MTIYISNHLQCFALFSLNPFSVGSLVPEKITVWTYIWSQFVLQRSSADMPKLMQSKTIRYPTWMQCTKTDRHSLLWLFYNHRIAWKVSELQFSKSFFENDMHEVQYLFSEGLKKESENCTFTTIYSYKTPNFLSLLGVYSESLVTIC